MGAEWSTDTNLDAIAAEVRSHPPLSVARFTMLLDDARKQPHGAAFNTVVEHHLAHALKAAIARRDRGIDVVDLFQEGSIAIVVALEAFTEREGSASQFGRYVDQIIELHLEAAIEREAAAVAAEQQLLADAERLRSARVTLRADLKRAPTDGELGGLLQWPAERVHEVLVALETAEVAHDTDIVQYLDDRHNDEPA